jgi:116 kDa U5 small nuclear ribonucleoprotein component
LYEKKVPETKYSLEFMAGLSAKPSLIRSISVLGHLHHGKTLLCDMFMEQAHHPPSKNWDLDKEYKWTDNRKDEVDRKLSLKCSPLTVVLPDTRGKHYLFNIVDTPGHPGISDEVSAALRLTDGVLLVVDCVEGVTFYVERLIKEAMRAQQPIVVLLNKLDRLVIELKLPPQDAYFKLKHTLDEVNTAIQKYAAMYSNSKSSLS